jgi:hypothetical protein
MHKSIYSMCLSDPLFVAGACRDRSAPIWASLSAERRELYRDVLQVHHGSSPFLEQ